MTHQRPLPDAAVSPYPIHPAPIDEAAEPAVFTIPTRGEDEARRPGAGLTDRFALPENLPLSVIGMGAAIGLGVAAVVGAVLYGRRKSKPEAEPAPAPRPRRSARTGKAAAAGKKSADDKSKRGTPDRVRVAGGEPYEVNYFARKHGLTPTKARAIIAQAGSDRAKANALAKGAKGKA